MRAPVLSATSSLDRICTIRSTIYSRMISELLFQHFHQAPPLQFTERPCLHDADVVAGLGLILLIVRVNFSLLPNLGGGTRVVVRTTIVLFMLLETTSPTRVLRVARPAASTADGSGGGW